MEATAERDEAEVAKLTAQRKREDREAEARGSKLLKLCAKTSSNLAVKTDDGRKPQD